MEVTLKNRINAVLKDLPKSCCPDAQTYVKDMLAPWAAEFFSRRPNLSSPPAVLRNVQVSTRCLEVSTIQLKVFADIDYGDVIARRVVSASRTLTVTSDTSSDMLRASVKGCIDGLAAQVIPAFFDQLPVYYPGAKWESCYRFNDAFESVQAKPSASGPSCPAPMADSDISLKTQDVEYTAEDAVFALTHKYPGAMEKILFKAALDYFDAKSVLQMQNIDNCCSAAVTRCRVDSVTAENDNEIAVNFRLFIQWEYEHAFPYQANVLVSDIIRKDMDRETAEKAVLCAVEDTCRSVLKDGLDRLPAVVILPDEADNTITSLLFNEALKFGYYSVGSCTVTVKDDRLYIPQIGDDEQETSKNWLNSSSFFLPIRKPVLAYTDRNEFRVFPADGDLSDGRVPFIMDPFVFEEDSISEEDIIDPDPNGVDFIASYLLLKRFGQIVDAAIMDRSLDIEDMKDFNIDVIVTAGKIEKFAYGDLELPGTALIKDGNLDEEAAAQFASECLKKYQSGTEYREEAECILNDLTLSDQIFFQKLLDMPEVSDPLKGSFFTDEYMRDRIKYLSSLVLRDENGEFPLVFKHYTPTWNGQEIVSYSLNPRADKYQLAHHPFRQFTSDEVKYIKDSYRDLWLGFTAHYYQNRDDLWVALKALAEPEFDSVRDEFCTGVPGKSMFRKLKGADIEFAKLILEKVPGGKKVIDEVWGGDSEDADD